MRVRTTIYGLIALLVVSSTPIFAQENYGMDLIEQKIVGSWRWVTDIASNDQYVFLASGNLGLQIIDPNRPQPVNCIGIFRPENMRIATIDLNNDLVIANCYGTVVMIDVSNPELPSRVNTIDSVELFDATGDLLYSYSNSTISCYNIADPHNIQLIGRSGAPENLVALCADGDLVCTIVEEGLLRFSDFSDPANPELINSMQADKSARRLRIIDNQLFFITLAEPFWHVVDLSDRERMQEIVTFNLPFGSYDYHISSEILTTINGDGTVTIYDISDIQHPDRRSSIRLDMNGWYPSVHYTNDRIFVGHYGLFVVDAEDFDHPSLSSYELGGYGMKDMLIRENSLFVGYDDGGVIIYDIENLENIEEVSRIPIKTGIERLAFDNDGKLYIMEEDIDSFLVFDVDDVHNWQQIGGMDMNVYDLDFVGSTAVAAVMRGPLATIDVSDPSNLGLLTERGYISRECYDVQVLGNYAYTTSYTQGLWVTDISNLAEPRVVCSVSHQHIHKLCGRDNFLVSTQCYNEWEGIYLYDCTEPEHPVRVGRHLSDGEPMDVKNATANRIVYSAEGEAGVRAFYVTEDMCLREIGRYDTPGIAQCIAADGNRLFVGDYCYIQVLECSEAFEAPQHKEFAPVEFSLSAPHPNPFNAVTRLTYGLPMAERVNLSICDIHGREIATLFSGEQVAGTHSVSWNAEGEPSGVYFCRLTTATQSHSQKVVLVR